MIRFIHKLNTWHIVNSSSLKIGIPYQLIAFVYCRHTTRTAQSCIGGILRE